MHRYVRPGTTATVDLLATTSVDVLVPEGLGPRTQVTGPNGRAFAAPGTTQALQRTELLPTAYGNKTADIPRPNLLGSLIVKAVAAREDTNDTTRHVRDLAFLASLADDPFTLRAQCTPKDKQRLRAAAAKLDDHSPAWQALASHADDGRDAWRILTT